MAILTAKKIREEINNNHIKIDLYDNDRLGPNSYDLTLFNKISWYRDDKYLDTRNPCNELETCEIPENGMYLFPNRLYLCKTNETVWSDKYVMELSGLSSLARLGIVIHQTAGYANIGHEFQWVLEITVTQAVKIYPDMRIAQQYFHTIEGDVELYNGRYKYKQLGDEICPSVSEEEYKNDQKLYDKMNNFAKVFIDTINNLSDIFNMKETSADDIGTGFIYEDISIPYNGESVYQLLDKDRIIDITDINNEEE